MVSEMDKSWMHSDRRSKAYEFGVEAFLNFAVENLLTTTHIRCPCVKCVNLKLFGVGIIRDHLYFNGIDQSYKNWTFHGEPWEATTNASRNVEEDDGHSRYSFVSEEIDMDDNDFGDFWFRSAKHGMSDVCFTELLILQGDLLPEGNTIPTSMWKQGKDSILKEGVPAKVVWYFPPIPRFKRMFQSHETAKSLTWHAARKSIDGYKACPICGDDTPSHRLKNGHKICYIGHRKWLPINHPYRRQRAAFNGKPEYGIPPEPLTGEEVLHMVENGDRVCWKKKSIFFDLEYWKYLPVRHALDVMHIEKNVCDSIIGTLLEIPGKNKDGIAARLDLLNMGVKTDLQPQYGERRTRLPPGPWNLSRAEKREVPEGYSSNIKNLVSLQDSRLLGLKSHDCHTLMQQLLPVAIRSVLEKPARYAITRLCFFFNAICAKTVDVSKLDKLEEDVVVTLCLLEKYFPPSFFDIMVHLVVHLVREVRLCGPVYFRWMYPFERYMKVLKGYVQNRTRPEGCIAERYIAEEAVEFCTQHLSDVSTVGVPSSQKMGVSKPLSGCTVSVVDQDLLNQAHLYVLENTEEVLPYIEQHMIHIKTAYPKFRKRTKWLQDKHNSTFIQWLRFKVQSELEEDNNGVSENLRWLAAGPNMAVPLYRSYLIKVLGDVIIECEPFTRGMPNVDTFDELVLATKQSVQKILDPD
ncbi:hypothetical protein Prudu_563S000100 [Prunus dulcis]|uniref:Transposable element protein n=1 Tax=Prunus dulcis TaxID=3755 RepID=A0A5H2Y2J0_PRUDU|nr:hypothetical protein Prudu_563S000100 [Prunus dulcis]